MSIVRLDDSRAAEYDAFLALEESTLFFYSDTYRRLLAASTGQEDHYSLLLDSDDEIAGALPAFVFRGGRYGNVLNSLPFYGSNGGVVEFRGDASVRRQLLGAFLELEESHGCVASVIITSPFDVTAGETLREFGFEPCDRRIGQITQLPPERDEPALLASFDSAARRNVARARRAGITASVDCGPDAFEFLEATHRENMSRIGGRAKSKRFFDAVARTCSQDEHYRVYVARLDGRPVAALLLFYFNRVVEYITPVIEHDFRSHQPLALLVHTAMLDAVDRGCRFWNWGGTWETQTGVYRFKRKWGAIDHEYTYYLRLNDPGILQLTPAEVAAAYPDFYVVPFDRLSQGVEPTRTNRGSDS